MFFRPRFIFSSPLPNSQVLTYFTSTQTVPEQGTPAWLRLQLCISYCLVIIFPLGWSAGISNSANQTPPFSYFPCLPAHQLQSRRITLLPVKVRTHSIAKLDRLRLHSFSNSPSFHSLAPLCLQSENTQYYTPVPTQYSLTTTQPRASPAQSLQSSFTPAGMNTGLHDMALTYLCSSHFPFLLSSRIRIQLMPSGNSSYAVFATNPPFYEKPRLCSWVILCCAQILPSGPISQDRNGV